jgi:hypothetical protein
MHQGISYLIGLRKKTICAKRELTININLTKSKPCYLNLAALAPSNGLTKSGLLKPTGLSLAANINFAKKKSANMNSNEVVTASYLNLQVSRQSERARDA